MSKNLVPGLRGGAQSSPQPEKKPWASDPDDTAEQDQINQVLGVRRQLGKDTKPKYIIDPRGSFYMGVWDAIQVSALVFTAFVTPFQVAFLEAAESAADGLFIVDRCIDVIFIVDMVLQFFLMYPPSMPSVRDAEQMAKNAAVTRDGGLPWVHDRKKIACHYLTTWFPIDIASVGASATDLYAAMSPPVDCALLASAGGGTASKLRGLRVLRVLRLMKLVRLLKASRVLKRWMSRLSIDYGTLILIKCFCQVLVCGHWIACLWKLQCWFAESALETWQASFGWCVPNVADPLQIQPPAVCVTEDTPQDSCPSPYLRTSEPGVCCVNVSSLYIASISWALMVITGVGGTDLIGLGPAMGGVSVSEIAVFTLLTIVGNGIGWTMVIAAFVDVATNSNPLNIIFRQTMDDLNNYMASQMMPHALRIRLREYFQEVHYVNVAEAQEKVLFKMSPMLQREVVLRANAHWLDKLWFIRGAEPGVFVQIVINLHPHVFAPGEMAPEQMLYIISKGVVLYGREVLTSGSIFGHEAMLISLKSLRVPYVGRMMSYVQCSVLARPAFDEIINGFPLAKKLVRRAAILLALRRKIIQVANLEKRKKKSFLDHVLDAAQDVDRSGVDQDLGGAKKMSGTADLGRIREMVKSEMEEKLAPLYAGMEKLLQAQGMTLKTPSPALKAASLAASFAAKVGSRNASPERSRDNGEASAFTSLYVSGGKGAELDERSAGGNGAARDTSSSPECRQPAVNTSGAPSGGAPSDVKPEQPSAGHRKRRVTRGQGRDSPERTQRGDLSRSNSLPPSGRPSRAPSRAASTINGGAQHFNAELRHLEDTVNSGRQPNTSGHGPTQAQRAQSWLRSESDGIQL